MTFHKWFLQQSTVVKVLLLIIPFVGWIVEILMRVTALLNKSTTSNILGLILYLILGILLAFVDVVLVLVGAKPFLLED